MFHILGPRDRTISLPSYTDFTNGLENSEICLSYNDVLLLFENIIHNG